jgi:xylulokinase
LILTLDLGTSTTKAVVWDGAGLRAVGRAPVETAYAAGGRAEQDPAAWWSSVVDACAEARAVAPGTFAAVEAVGFAAARQTFVPVTAAGEPLGPALVWSDRRASAEAEAMAGALGGTDAVRRRTGGVLDGAAVPAKAAWLAAHDPDRWAASRWLLTPRDLLVREMTGEVVTDVTMVAAAGLSDASGDPVAELMDVIGDRLPPVLAPPTVVGAMTAGPAGELGVPAGVPVVVGAGDRACEVLGTAAAADRPMVSWGTTANVSVVTDVFPDPAPGGVTVTRGALGGWLLEGGLSAAGSLVTWLSRLTGTGPGELMARAAAAPAGAHGVVALPWFGGARAPWWRDGAGGAFVGLGLDHDAGDLCRAVVEAVAWEVRRCLHVSGALTLSTSLALTGADGTTAPWVEVLTAVTGRSAVRRRSGQAASAGAALLTARAIGADYDLDRLDPVVETVAPDAAAVARYAELAALAGTVAETVVALDMREAAR